MVNEPSIKVRHFKNGYIKFIEGYIHKVDPTHRHYIYMKIRITKQDLKDIVEMK